MAKIRTNTASDLWFSASKLLPDFRIGTNGNIIMADYTTGKVGIGTTIPDEKLHVGGNIKANGDIKTNQGIYAAGTGGLNLVPLGVFKVAYDSDNDGNISNINLTNIAGSVLTGAWSYSKIAITNDLAMLTLTINLNSIPVEYSTIIINGTPKMLGTDLWVNINASFYSTPNNPISAYFPNDDSRTALITNGFTIESWVDAFDSSVRVVGTFMVYGIK